MTDKAAREAYFRDGERMTREYYLADPSNPYGKSGKSGGTGGVAVPGFSAPADAAQLAERGCRIAQVVGSNPAVSSKPSDRSESPSRRPCCVRAPIRRIRLFPKDLVVSEIAASTCGRCLEAIPARRAIKEPWTPGTQPRSR